MDPAIYTDSAWGGLVKGRSGTSADIALQASDGSIKVMIKPVGIGFQGTSAIAKPTVTGAKGLMPLASVAQLACPYLSYGLVTRTPALLRTTRLGHAAQIGTQPPAVRKPGKEATCMTVLAGQMTQTPTGNPEWSPCDGRPVYVLANPKVSGSPILPRPATAPGTGYRQDYVRRVGHQGRRRGLGPLGWIVCLPADPSATWYIKMEDDSADTTLTGTPPTPLHPPAGVK